VADLIARPREPRWRDLRLLAKITFASMLAWWFATLLGADTPVFAAIMPLVALKADDPYGAVGVSLVRVLGTVAGVIVGVIALELSPNPTLLAVTVVIVVSLALGLFIRSPNESISHITAVVALIVLLLGPSEATSYGIARIWETFLGAGIAIVIAIVLWPPDPIKAVARLVEDLAADALEDLDAVASLPGRPLHEAASLLDERLQASMGVGDPMRTLDRADSALRWNLRHRKRREAFWALAVRVRQLRATSRHARAIVWSLVSNADGDRTPGLTGEASSAYTEALRHLAVGAGAIGAGADPGPALDRARESVTSFAAAVAGNPAPSVEADLLGALRQMLRVQDPMTSRRLEALLRERYAGT
jgi:uncharacterized membrane protein YgaE (UPF0421/DUF939 family)